jgi:hypothetical protein
MSREDGASVARRAWLRAVLWGAGGLSLLPGCSRGGPIVTCYKPAIPTGQTGGTSGSTLARWRELGRIWRELSVHLRGKYELEEGEEKLKALEAETTNALAALPASRELRTLFEERIAHVRRSRYVMATCYEMAPWNSAAPRGKVEEQMTALHRLEEEGKLTPEAAGKAARVVAVQAEYMTQLNAAEPTDGEADYEQVRKLWERYRDGGTVPGEGAIAAGRDVVEFEVDDPDLLPD